jgi:hypothetical protein
VFGIAIVSDLNASLSDIVPVLQGTGVTAEKFTSVSTFTEYLGSSQTQKLQWTFSMAVPFSKFKDLGAALNGVMQTLLEQKSALSLSFVVNGTQVSQALQESQPCSRSDLTADARVQAQKLADAAGLTLGPILGISGATLGCSAIVKFASPVSGQSDQNALTVTATRAINVQPDQASFSVEVKSTGLTGLDEIVGVLEGSGITAADLSSVYGFPPSWRFTLVAPFSKMKETITALGTLRQKLSANNPPFDLSFDWWGRLTSCRQRNNAR